MKYIATILITTQLTQKIEVDIPDEIDFNPAQWDEWEQVLEAAGVTPTVLDSDVVSATTHVIQYDMIRKGIT